MSGCIFVGYKRSMGRYHSFNGYKSLMRGKPRHNRWCYEGMFADPKMVSVTRARCSLFHAVSITIGIMISVPICVLEKPCL